MGRLRDLARSWTRRAAERDAAARDRDPDDHAVASVRRSARGLAYERARRRIAEHPDDADAWADAAHVLLSWGRQREAYDAFRAAIARAPPSGAIARAFATCAWGLGRRDEAEHALRAALAATFEASTALALARLLTASGRGDDARDLALKAASTGADRVESLATLARCDRASGDVASAEHKLREATALAPDEPLPWRELASLLEATGRVDDAIAAYERAVDAGGDAMALAYARAERSRRRADYEGEAACLVDELRVRPSTAGHFMLAEALIAQGRYVAGWRQFEFRKFEAAMLDAPRIDGVRPWRGEPLDGRTILVKAEQGIGDVAWFARYLPLLARRGARVVLLPRIDMQRVSRGFASVDHVLSEGELLPPLDFQVSLMSLAMHFGTTLASIPGGVPYLTVDPAVAERWMRRLPEGGDPRVGIVWAGKPAQARNAQRSIPLAQLLPLLRVPGCRFYALQKGPAESEIAALPDDVALEPLGAAFDDLEDLLGAIARMDLVVSVCTGPAHVAGAMGKPVWTMISSPPDLRWMQRREDSPWYPTMRLFRQSAAGRWDDVIAAVARELARGHDAIGARPAKRDRETMADDDGRDDIGLARVVETGAGVLMVDEHDPADRLACMLPLAAAGQVVLHIGAGVGADAMALGRVVGRDGHLLLHETDPRRRAMLVQNLAAARITHASVLDVAPDDEGVDDLALERLDGLVVDGGEAAAVLDGATATLWRCRPWMALASADADAAALATRLRELGYVTWRADAFAEEGTVALLALPEERDGGGAMPGCVQWP